MIDGLFRAYNTVQEHAADLIGLKPQSHTRLYTADGEDILVADDSSMVSLIHLHGTLKAVGPVEFDAIAEKLATVLKTPLERSCHTFQFVMHYDPDTAHGSISKEFEPLKQSAHGLGLDLDAVLDDWSGTISGYCADERLYIAVWTRPTIMTPGELKQVQKDAQKEPVPYVDSQTQGFRTVIPRMRSMHQSRVKETATAFTDMGFKCEILDTHSACRAIRTCIAPNRTARDWRPRLPGDPLPVRLPDPGAKPDDMSNLFPPKLAKQLWPCDAELIENRYVEVDDIIYAPVIVELAPQTPKPFNILFQSLRKSIPWRGSILITGDGMRGQMLKYQIARVLSFTSMNNKQFAAAYRGLENAQLDGSCNVGVKMVFTTWVDKRKHKDPLRVLAQNASTLHTAIQSWGSCDTSDLTGNALLALTATLPACMPTSPAPLSVAPLTDAVQLLPVTRVCSPWKFTDLPLRTPDGRYMPVGLFHSNMASWNEIIFAGMGAGKSVFLNTLNFFFIIRRGQVRLPWLTIIDIGISSSGLINLIQAALPSDKKHLAVFARLRNTKDSAINPFDTPLGCDAPLTAHLDFLINLLSLLCTPIEKTAPVDGIAGLLREAVDTTYRRLGRHGEEAKKYDPYTNKDVQAALEKNGFQRDSNTTWWEVVDFLFSLELIPLAVSAQRFAMPVITDVAATCNDPLVRSNFENLNANEGGEKVPAACVRYLTTATKEYPILANPTRFGLGAARIVGLDLQEVTPRGGPGAMRQSGIMYMVARFVGAAHFFHTDKDIDNIHAEYREYHRPRFESLASDPKRLVYDEFHRASCIDENNPLSKQIIADLTTASRESRKQNLSIGLASQQLLDFPKVIVDLSTSVYALGAGNYQEAQEISDRFGFNNAARFSLSKISRPTAAGANFIALYRTSDGESVLYLTNCLGGYAKWAFSTTAEDMRVRNKLYNALGCKRTLEILQKVYPNGTIKEELERRKTRIEVTEGEHSVDLEVGIFQELQAKALELQTLEP
jgi:intracellular multiplication protein IcmB